MNEAPERIYSGPSVDDKGVFWDVGHWDKEPDEGCIEYVRADRIEELEAKLAKAVVYIEWFISEDETNRGDYQMPERNNKTWNEINEYWIKHLDEAIDFVANLTGGKDE